MKIIINFEARDEQGNVLVERSQTEIETARSELARDHLQEIVEALQRAKENDQLPANLQELTAAKQTDDWMMDAATVTIRRFLRLKLREWARS